MVIFAPVFGFLPGRVARLRTLNVPNPVITTFSPLFNESRIALSKDITASRDALWVRLAFLATSSIRSFFVNELSPPLGQKMNLEIDRLKIQFIGDCCQDIKQQQSKLDVGNWEVMKFQWRLRGIHE